MDIPGNLISDSTTVQETFELVTAHNGRISCIDVASAIFQLANVDANLAAFLVGELVQNDPRFVIEDAQLTAVDDKRESRGLNEIEFVVLDVEAVHERNSPTRMIEIGAYRVLGGAIIDEFQSLINPGTSLPRFLVGLTGISDEMLKSAPVFDDIAGACLDFIGDAVVVAHNTNFDLSLLNREIARVFPGRRLRNSELCTVKLARRLVPQLESHKLDALTAYFGFEIARRHRAADDALATARVFLRLLDELSIQGVSTLAEARRFEARLPAGDYQLAFDA